MANQFHQFNMVPGNFNPMLAQQQAGMVPQPNQFNNQTPMPNIMAPADQARQLQHLAQQRGAHLRQAGDGGLTPQQQQMMEMLRRKQMQQAQQQQQQQQQNLMKAPPPQFNLPNQMNAMAGSSFGDATQMQSFPNLGNNMGNGMNQTTQQARNALFHQLQSGQQGQARQLELMTMAQHQQNQHRPPASGNVNPNLGMFYPQSQQQPHQQQPQMTPQTLQDHQRPQMMGPQNGQFPPSNGQMFTGQQLAAQQGQAAAMNQIQAMYSLNVDAINTVQQARIEIDKNEQRRAVLIKTVESANTRRAQLLAGRPSTMDPNYENQLNHMNTQSQRFSQMLTRCETLKGQLQQRLQNLLVQEQQHQQGGLSVPSAADGANMAAMLSTSPRPTSTPSVGAMGNVPGRNWMQGGPSPQAPMTTPTMSHQAGPMMQNRSPQVPGMQPQPGQPMPSHDLGVPQQAQGPPRTATTPINPPRQNGIQGTPAMSNLIREAGNIIGVQQIAGTGQRPYQGIAPLSQQAFFTAHKNFLDRQGVPLDKRQPSIQGIPVDLHYLHSEVMRAGGPHNLVNAYGRPLEDVFAILGGKTSFMSIPTDGREPDKCSPAIANTLQQIYKNYLANFDTAYVKSKMAPQQQVPQPGMNHSDASQGGQMNGVPGSQPLQQNPQLPASALGPNNPLLKMMAGGLDPKKVQDLLALAKLSPEELRARNIPEDLRRNLALNGAYLKQMVQNQQQFHAGIRTGLAQRHNQPSGSGMLQQQQQQQHQQQQQQQQPGQGMMAPNMQGQVGPQGPSPQSHQANGAMPTNWPIQQPNVPQMIKPPQQPNGDGQARPMLAMQGGPQAIGQAVRQVELMKTQFLRSQQQSARDLKEIHVPEQQIVDYRQTFTQLDTLARDLERKLPVVAPFHTQEEMKHMVTLSLCNLQQRSLLSSSSPKFVMELNLMKRLIEHIQQVNDKISKIPPEQREKMMVYLNAMRQHAQQQQQQAQQHQQQQQQQQQQIANAAQHNRPSMMQPPPVPQPIPQPAPPPAAQQPPPSQSMPPPQPPQLQQAHPPQPPQPQQQAQVPPQPQPHQQSQPQPATPSQTAPSPSLAHRKKPHTAPTPTDTTAVSTPPAQAATPVASAATPSHVTSSPNTPKSPKVKGPPKPRQPQRRKPSAKTVAQPPAPAASTPTPAAASTPVAASPAAATPASTAESSTAPAETGQKRRREEEPSQPVASTSTSQPSPPKKVKTDWESPSATESHAKKPEEPQNINSVDDGLKYLQDSQEQFHRSEDTASSESLQTALLELGKIFSSDAGASDVNFDLSVPGESSNESALQMFDLINFDAYTQEMPRSLAPPTPELSHSTNPSPASVGGSSDGEHGPSTSAHLSDSSVTIAGADSSSATDLDDLLFNDTMFSSMKGLGGGEATYFTHSVFDYESNLLDTDDAWALT